ncbi:hypothetical protein ACSBPH_08415 [Microbacterium sp. F51-2R]|uniref:hypothetical protein n=1 Tax=Microbacterium sp. F51-2R TaxID=3445777 RepID=UPI003FA018FD
MAPAEPVTPPSDDLDAADNEIRKHPGSRASRRISNVNRIFDVWRDFTQTLDELLARCETDEDVVVALTRNVGDTTGRESLVRMLDQSLLAYVAGLVAVVDQSRPIVDLLRPASRKEALKRTSILLAAHPEGLFLAKLRNYILHYLAAPWRFAASFGEGQPLSGEVSLDTEQLLEWDGWKGAKEFIVDGGSSIRLSPLIRPHFLATAEYLSWLLDTAASDNHGLIEQANGLIARRNLILTGGVSDGHDWAERVAHMEENLRRARRGEPQTDFRTGKPIQE